MKWLIWIIFKMHRCPLCFSNKRPGIDPIREISLSPDEAFKKRTILLPAYKAYWEAEAEYLNYRRLKMIRETPLIQEKLYERVEALQGEIYELRRREPTAFVQNKLVEAEARINEIRRISHLADTLGI